MEPSLNLNVGSAVSSAISNIGQFATTYAVPTFNSPDILAAGGGTTNPSDIDQFFSKVGSVFSEGGHLIESAADWTGRQVAEGVKGAIDLPGSMYNFGMDAFHTSTYSNQQDNITNQINDLGKQFASGQISLNDYSDQMKELGKQNTALSGKMKGLTTKIATDGNAVIHNTITTTADVLTVMSAGLTSPLMGAADTGTQDTATFLLSKAADDMMNPAEDSISNLVSDAKLFNSLPEYVQNSVKASVTDRLLEVGADATSASTLRSVAANLALKYPIAFNYLSNTGTRLYDDFSTGKYGAGMKSLGINAAMMLSGGPIGKALAGLGKVSTVLKEATYGSSSFLDTLSAEIGDHNPSGLFNAIKGDPELIRNFQALEATNMVAEDGRVGDAAYRVINGLKADGWDMNDLTHEQFASQVNNWNNAQRLLNETLTSKLGADEARKYVVGRWTAQDANRIAAAVTQGDLGGESQTVEDRLQAWEAYKAANPNMSFANNENLNKQLTELISKTDNVSELDTKIRLIKAQVSQEDLVPKDVAQQIAKMGYVPISPAKLEAPFLEGANKLVTNATEASDEFFTKAVQPIPVLKEVGSVLTFMGLSPVRADQSVQDIYSANLAVNLQKTSIVGKLAGATAEDDANTVVQKLSDYANETRGTASLTHPPISDLRQMTQKEIMAALDVTKSQAGEVQDALMDSMLEVPLSVRGLGDRIVDYAQKGTLGAGMRQYLRVQGAGRFAWNPFFKMKMAYKTEALSQLETGGKWPSILGTNKLNAMIFQGKYGDLQDTVNVLDNKGLFGSGFSNEATNETNVGFNTLGNETRDEEGNLVAARGGQRVLQSQKLSIAGVVSSMADKAGMSVDDFTTNFPNETRDAIQAILHYDPTSSFLNSPLARTLNFAFFPFRFNVKVTTFMAKALASQDALTQVAVLNGLMEAHHFLSSNEGQIWYSQNSDVIGLLTYFSPMETISAISALGHIGHESVGAFGELGGLPAGFILEMLQSQGFALNTQQAYLDPKTGQPDPNYIPQGMRAKLASAISSFIGSLFTYPGSEAGLPSKAGILNKVGEGLTGTSSTNWTQVPPTNLTPSQQSYEQTINQFNQTSQASKQVKGTSQGGTISVPQLGTATAQPFYTKTDSSTRPTPKLKKDQEPLSLLPGQTSIGQIP